MANGRVKWFNNTKGYGFIEQENGVDVFVHHSGINISGYKAPTGDRVKFDIEQGQKRSFSSKCYSRLVSN